MEPVIMTRDLRKSYNDKIVLRAVNLEVAEGSIHALLGPNGAGKTTLVRILSTLAVPDGGTARVAGFDLLRESTKVRAAISLTGQYAALDESLTGRENMLLMGRLWKLDRHEAYQRAAKLLDMLELSHAADRLVQTYSGGMRRKLDLAMSLIAKPRVLFLDEPTTGLDPHSRNALWDIVRNLRSEGVTVLLTTQYLEEADQLADRISVMDGGRIITEGSSQDLKRQLSSEIISLSFENESSARDAQIVLHEESLLTVESPATVRVATDGSARHVYALLDRLNDAGIRVERVTIKEPTLDDVFLALTDSSRERDVEEAA